MSDQPDITEIDLHAFIDGELDTDQSKKVQAAIETDPALEARAAAYRADKALLKGIYGPLIDRPLPNEWIALAQAGAAPARTTNWRLMGAVAALLLVMVGVGGTYWGLRPAGESGDVVQLALDARETALAVQKLVAVNGVADARRYNAVLSGIVASNIKVPDLSRMDYQLTSIRFYGNAAELSYHDSENRLFTLYLRRSDGKPRFDQFERNGLRICVWQDDQISMVMAGNVSVAAMQKLASLAYIGLTV